MFKKFFPVIFSVVCCVPVSASGEYERHYQLAQEVVNRGVSIKVNPSECDGGELMGWYNGARRELVVCQENKVQGSSAEVAWTGEDYDTLRHEVHHFVQDCLDNSLNGNLSYLYDQPLRLGVDVLGTERVGRVIKLYEESSHDRQVLEVEAFAVAGMNDVEEQVKDIKQYCGGLTRSVK